ncbi:MAG: lysophospholipid acyltransferase family protein [Fibrobacterota bacterium]
MTLRKEDRTHLQGVFGGQPVIFAFSHSHIFGLTNFLRGRGLYALVSSSRDGEKIMRLLIRMGFREVRGSSSKGGAGAFTGLLRALKKGNSVCITPDGPKGPRGLVKSGVVELAARTGAIIVPMAFSAEKSFKINSWDSHVIPRPFSRVRFETGKFFLVENHGNSDETEKIRRKLEDELKTIEQKCRFF